jgi:hypothetical protein
MGSLERLTVCAGRRLGTCSICERCSIPQFSKSSGVVPIEGKMIGRFPDRRLFAETGTRLAPSCRHYPYTDGNGRLCSNHVALEQGTEQING